VPIIEWLNQPGGLADRLRRLRRATGKTQEQFAVAAEWPANQRTKVSKLEGATQWPSVQDIRDWVKAANASPDVADELIGLLNEAEGRERQIKHLAAGGQAAIQKEYDLAVREGKDIRNFEPLMIPGLLQTREYARYRVLAAIRNHAFPEDQADESLKARMDRQDVLWEPDRHFEFVIGEEALYRRLAPLPVLIAQIDRLLVLDLPHVTLGIIPLDADLSEGLELMEEFLLIDGVVYLETYAELRDPAPVESAEYEAVANALRAQAVTGDEARRLLIRAGDHLRGLS
jgi:transcriptional regulator with XRE-family HTH domain